MRLPNGEEVVLNKEGYYEDMEGNWYAWNSATNALTPVSIGVDMNKGDYSVSVTVTGKSDPGAGYSIISIGNRSMVTPVYASSFGGVVAAYMASPVRDDYYQPIPSDRFYQWMIAAAAAGKV